MFLEAEAQAQVMAEFPTVFSRGGYSGGALPVAPTVREPKEFVGRGWLKFWVSGDGKRWTKGFPIKVFNVNSGGACLFPQSTADESYRRSTVMYARRQYV